MPCFSLPESPATNIFSLGMFFPRSVKGLRVGILMVGMINCGGGTVSEVIIFSLSLGFGGGEGAEDASGDPSIDPISLLRCKSSIAVSENPSHDLVIGEFKNGESVGKASRIGVPGWRGCV